MPMECPWSCSDATGASSSTILTKGHDPRPGLRRSAALIAKGEERAAELIAQANLNAEAARERLALDVNDLETFNAESHVFNERVAELLKVCLDAPAGFGDDEDAWRSWYYDLIGYRYTPPPKVMVAENGTLDLPTPTIVSCFAAGTPVPTREGTRPIESIRTGDQVLSQDVTSGALAFRTVMAVHHNPPDKTLRVTLDNGDAVVASRFHRFWLAGIGWAMARDLKPGDVVRTLAGPAHVVSVDDAPVQPVFNLDVAESRTYFVGKSEMLVHDNTLPPPHAGRTLRSRQLTGVTPCKRRPDDFGADLSPRCAAYAGSTKLRW